MSISPPLTISELVPIRCSRVIIVREGGIDLIRKLDTVDYTYSVLRILRHGVTWLTFTTLISSKIRHFINTYIQGTMTRTKQAARRGRGGRKSDGANTRPKGDGVAPTPASLIGELSAFLECWS